MRSSIQNKSSEGIRPIVMNRIQTDVLQSCSSKFPGYMVLIVDEASTRIISSCVGMYKLMESRVNLVEDLTKNRAPYRQSAPIYFLSPTLDSVNRLIEDWTYSKKKKPLYADSIFLYFTKALPDDLLQKIKACKPLVKRLKAFNEVNIDFIASEIRAFHFDMESSFAPLNRKNHTTTTNAEAEAISLSIASKLVTLCAQLNEYPHIRYRSSSPVASSLATHFHQKLTEYIGSNETWWYHGDAEHAERGRATLLLLSRADDCLSPLLHEFTYQAMVYDLLDVNREKITYTAEMAGSVDPDGNAVENMDKDALLNDDDELWVELRGKHIADVIQILSGRIREIVNSSTGVALSAKGSKAKALSLTQMSNALRALPEYREVMSKLTQHMNMAHRCMDIFNSENLIDLSDLEQTLATGKTDEGKDPKVADMVEQVESALGEAGNILSRFRLLAIFIVSQDGLRPEDEERLMNAARLDPFYRKALQNFEILGIPMVKAAQGGNRLSMSLRKAGMKLISKGNTDNSDSQYASSRFACELKGILQELQENKLSLDDFPSVLPMPVQNVESSGHSSMAKSVRSSTGGSRFSRRGTTDSTTESGAKLFGARQIVFMAGGACYSELRTTRDLMAAGGPETIIGCTHLINPGQFVKDLASL